MELRGNYSKYREQLADINELLQHEAVREFFEKLNKSKLLEEEKDNLFGEVGELNEAWKEIANTLNGLKTAQEDFDTLVTLNSLDFKANEILSVTWKRLQKSQELIGKVDKFNRSLKAHKEEIKGLPELNIIDDMLNPESEFGQAFYTMSNKMTIAFTNLTSIAAIEATERVVGLYDGAASTDGNTSIKDLKKNYDQSLADYDKKLDYFKTAKKKDFTTTEVENKVIEAKESLEKAQNNKAYYQSDEYVREQTGAFNSSQKESEKQAARKKEVQREQKQDKALFDELDELERSLKAFTDFQHENGKKTPEELKNELDGINDSIASLRKRIKGSEAQKKYEEAKKRAEEFGKKNPATRKTEEQMQAQIVMASVIKNNLDDIGSERRQDILSNGILLKDYSKDDPQKQFKFILQSSNDNDALERMAERMHELLPKDVNSVDDITIANVKKFILETQKEDYIYDQKTDFLFDGLIAYVQMIEMEGVTKAPVFIKEKQILKGETKDISEPILKSILMRSHLNMFDGFQTLGIQNNIIDEIRGKLNAVNAKLAEKEISKQDRAECTLGKASLEQQLANYEAEREKQINDLRELQKSLKEIEEEKYKLSPEFVKELWRKMGFKEPSESDTLSNYAFENMAKQNGSFFLDNYKILHEFVDEEEIKLQTIMLNEAKSQEVLGTFEKPFIEDAYIKLKKGDKDIVAICKELMSSSVDLINKEAELMSPGFKEYTKLKIAEKEALNELNSSDDNFLLLQHVREQERLQRELKERTNDQKYYANQLLEKLTTLAARDDLDERFGGKDSAKRIQSLKDAIKQLSGGDYVLDGTVEDLTGLVKGIRKSVGERILERRNEIERIDNGQKRRMKTMQECSAESITRMQEVAQMQEEKAKEHFDKSKDVLKSMDKAAENGYQLYEARGKLADGYTRQAQGPAIALKTALSNQINSFLQIKDKLPKKLIGSDSGAYSSIFEQLKLVSKADSIEAIEAQLATIKGAAEQYIIARKGDFKWFSWKENGKSDSGNARIHLAQDIVDFCVKQTNYLQALKPSVLNEIKKDVNAYRMENEGFIFDGDKADLLQKDIDRRKLADKIEARKKEQANQLQQQEQNLLQNNLQQNLNPSMEQKELQRQGNINIQINE